MIVKPNTPTLPFQPMELALMPLGEASAELVRIAGWIGCFTTEEENASAQLYQAAASLALLAFFDWPKPTRDQRTLRKELRNVRSVKRAYLSVFGAAR